MIPTMRLDTRQWQAAAKELFETSSRTCVDFTNGQALKVAVEAVRQTHKANAAKIEQTLGATGRAVSFAVISRGARKGQIRVKKGLTQTREDSFAERILGKRFRLTGAWGVKGSTMQERIHNLIVARKRAASFIASGWIGARNALWAFVKQKPAGTSSLLGARQYGQPKGAARHASFSLRSQISAFIQNTALMQFEGKAPAPGGDPMPTAIRGLQAALNVAAQDMAAELARRLDPDFKKVSVK